MKRLKVAIILLLIILTTNSQGDIIITKSRTDNRHKIINLIDYPDITAFVVYKDKNLPQFAHMGFSRVYKDAVIRKHLFCSMELFAVKNEYLKNREDKDIDWEDKKNVIKSNVTLLPDSDETDVKDVREVEHSYNIVGFSDTAMVLYKAKKVYKYKNKQPDLVQYFDYEGDVSKLHQDFK